MMAFKLMLCRVFGHRWKIECYRVSNILRIRTFCARCGVEQRQVE